MICVWGATGNQGCSVVKALTKDGKWTVRAITRDANSDDAKALKTDYKCEVMEGDYTGAQDQIVNCMKGCYGAYLMTNFWDPASMNKENELGKKLVDAAKTAGVKHIVWSTLPNVEKISKGKYKVPHFTDKAKVEEYARKLMESGAFQYCSFVAPAFYYQNFDNLFPPKKEGDTWVFTLPNVPKHIAYDVDETGPAVVTALNNPEQWNLKRIDYVGDNMPTEDYIKTWSKVTGKKARFNAVPIEEMMKTQKEMAEMFGWFRDYTYYGPDSDPKSGQMCTPGGLSNFEKYLTKTMKTGPE